MPSVPPVWADVVVVLQHLDREPDALDSGSAGYGSLLTARPPAVDSLVVVAHPLPMMNRIRPHRLCEERGRGSEPPDFLVATEVIVIADQT